MKMMLRRVIGLISFAYASNSEMEDEPSYTLYCNGVLEFKEDATKEEEISKILESINDITIIKSVKEIDLSKRDLDKIPSGITKFTSLEVLSLCNNKITRISNGAFKGLSSLKELNIGENQLEEIDNEAFKGLSNLRELDLYTNHLTTIDSNLFKGLSSLEELNLGSNKLKTIGGNLFKELSNLQVLYIDGNELETIDSKAFEKLENLVALYLDGNLLTEIDNSLFKELSNLETLNLYNNKLNTIGNETFNQLSDLEELNLGNNNLSTLDVNLFNGLSKLKELWLDGNLIAKIDVNLFNGLSSLEKLNLDNNNLSTLDVNLFNGLSKLKELWLDGNLIAKIDVNLFNGLSSLEELHLDNNNLSTLDVNLFNGLPKLKELWLDNNNLSTLDSDLFNGLSNLEELYLGDNKLSTIGFNMFKGLSNLKKLGLYGNNIKTLDNETFNNLSNLKELYFNTNKLTTINGDPFRVIPNLSVLDLNNNQLTEIDTSLFEVLKNLRWIDLQNNKLTTLPDSVKNLNQRPITISITNNVDFSLESGDGTLGIQDLQKMPNIILNCNKNQLNFYISIFIDGYSKKKSLHWNLNKLKELKLPAVEDSSLDMNKMLKIVDEILTVDEKLTLEIKNNTMMKENIKDYIERIHEKEVKIKRKYPMINNEEFPIARRQLGNILEHLSMLAENGHGDIAKMNLAVLSNGMTECPHGQIAALNDAYALICSDYKSQSGEIVDMIEHRIAILKDSKFRSLVTPPNSEHNVHVLNYWMNSMKDILGFTVNLNMKVKDSLFDDPFDGDSIAVLLSFLNDVFAPDKIIDTLTEKINGENMVMKNGLLYSIFGDETLSDSEKEELQPGVSNTSSNLYKVSGGVTRDAVKYILTKTNLLIENDNSIEK